MNINVKLLLTTLGIFAALYMFLNWFVPAIGLDKAMQNTFISINQSIYNDYNGKGDIDFVAAKGSTSNYQLHPFKTYDDDVLIKMMNQDQVAAAVAQAKREKRTSVNVGHAEFYVDVWQFLTLPMILLVSLILATPMKWRNPKAWLIRLGSLGVGLLVFFLFSTFRFWVRFTTEVNRHGWLELGTLSDSMAGVLKYMNTFLINMGIVLAICVIIWAAVSFPFVNREQFFLEEA